MGAGGTVIKWLFSSPIKNHSMEVWLQSFEPCFKLIL